PRHRRLPADRRRLAGGAASATGGALVCAGVRLRVRGGERAGLLHRVDPGRLHQRGGPVVRGIGGMKKDLAPRFWVGRDLGSVSEPTALAILERTPAGT